MSQEKNTADEFQDDAKQSADLMKKAAKGGKKAIKGAKKAAKAAKAAASSAKAVATAAKAVVVLKVIGIGLLVALVIVILYFILNNVVFSVLHKLFPTEDDIRQYIENTKNNPDDWRFQYNKMLPEEQYEYIYFGNHPSRDANKEGKEVDGLADYIINAYLDARKSFEQDLGDIKDYHDKYFGNNSDKTATIDDVYPHSTPQGESDGDEDEDMDSSDTELWTVDQINEYIDSNGIGVTENRVGDYPNHTEWYEKNHVCVEDGVTVRKRIQEYVKKLDKFRESGKKYSCGYFDYLIFEQPLPEDDSLPELKARAVLNLDLTYLANHEILVGDIEQALDGKIVKDSELTNVVTYLISGMDVATCEISPAKGYLDFLKKTIGNRDVWDLSNKYKGKFTFTGVLGVLLRNIEEETDYLDYSLFTQATVKYKVDGKTKKQKMGILDTTACEVVIMQGAEENFVDKYGKPVYQYYLVLKNPVDTDRLLWAMFVSDAAKTVTYEGIFNSVCQAYQGSYYDMYCVFEPLNADLGKNWFLSFVIGLSADNTSSLTFAKWADSEEIRKYLYGLNEDEVKKKDKYFKNLWTQATSSFATSTMKNYIKQLETQYLVDKNNDGKVNYKDFTGLLNETYYTYIMRPLYKCDSALISPKIEDRHNLAHDGFGVTNFDSKNDYEKCLWHKIFPNDTESSSCNACLRKNGGYEAAYEDKGGINCAEWASDWPAKCPDCGQLAQHTITGKVYVEYVRDPKPEFATLITISKKEYKEKILGEAEDDSADIGVVLTALKGNEKIDLKTNYNRYKYGNNYSSRKTIATENENVTDNGHFTVPEKSAFYDEDNKNKYYFSVYEFYGEYATKEKYVDNSTRDGIDNLENAHEGTLDLITFNPDESLLEEFESKQEISEGYNRELWTKWAQSNGTVPPRYRAVSILSALYKRKYYYHNLLATDTLQAGYYDEDNGYERPIANYYGTEDDKAAYDENFNKDHSSDDVNDTALYGKNFEGFEEDKADTNSSSRVGDVRDALDFHTSDGEYLYFYCPTCNPYQEAGGGECAVSIDAYNNLEDGAYCSSSACSNCGAVYLVNEIPEFTPQPTE